MHWSNYFAPSFGTCNKNLLWSNGRPHYIIIMISIFIQILWPQVIDNLLFESGFRFEHLRGELPAHSRMEIIQQNYRSLRSWQRERRCYSYNQVRGHRKLHCGIQRILRTDWSVIVLNSGILFKVLCFHLLTYLYSALEKNCYLWSILKMPLYIHVYTISTELLWLNMPNWFTVIYAYHHNYLWNTQATSTYCKLEISPPHNRQCGLVFCSVRQHCGINPSHISLTHNPYMYFHNLKLINIL